MAPSFRVTTIVNQAVVNVTASSFDCIVHFVAGQSCLMTTKSARFAKVDVGEYKTRIIESEHTCTFNTPDACVKRTPSTCCCTAVIGFNGVHWACAMGAHNHARKR